MRLGETADATVGEAEGVTELGSKGVDMGVVAVAQVTERVEEFEFTGKRAKLPGDGVGSRRVTGIVPGVYDDAQGSSSGFPSETRKILELSETAFQRLESFLIGSMDGELQAVDSGLLAQKRLREDRPPDVENLVGDDSQEIEVRRRRRGGSSGRAGGFETAPKFPFREFHITFLSVRG